MDRKSLVECITLSSIPIRSVDNNNMPTGIASACIIDYENKNILLTVHHATGNMENWGIQVKYVPTKGTQIKPLGSMNFLKTLFFRGEASLRLKSLRICTALYFKASWNFKMPDSRGFIQTYF